MCSVTRPGLRSRTYPPLVPIFRVITSPGIDHFILSIKWKEFFDRVYFLYFFCYLWSPYVCIYLSMIGWFCFLFYSNDKSGVRKVKKSGRQKARIPKIFCQLSQMGAFFRTEYGHRKKFWSDKFRTYFTLFLIFPDNYR